MSTDKSFHRRILLLYPETPDTTYWSYSHALHLLGKRALLPPLGLLTIAGLLPPGDEVRLRDLNIESCTDEDWHWADAVFVSAMIAQKNSLAQCIEQANRKGVPVVAGGPYPTTCYAEIAGVDHIILGEAEVAFPVFLRDWNRGNAKRAYARSADAKETAKILSHFGADADAETVDERVNLDESPMPRFDLLDLGAYRSMAIQTSRGCPHGCEFCDIWRRFGRRPRYKSIPRVLAELSELHQLGWRSSIFVVDDNFVGNPMQAKALLKRIAEWQRERNHPFDFSTEAALTLADDEALLAQMAASGFDMVFIGLETPNEESLRETHKAVNASGQMNRRVRKIQAAGIQVTAGFILGFDHDPDDIADQMIDFINELSIPVAMVGLLMALPETDLHDRLKQEGRLRQASDGNNTHEFKVNFTPRRREANLISDYKKVLQTLYSDDLKSYFDRCAGLRKHWKPVRQKKRSVRWFEVVWLFRYLFRSIFTTYAWNSARFLLNTLWEEPRFFPTAVSLGIQGHHFREITRLAFRLDELKQTYAALVERYIARFQSERKAFQVYAANRMNEGRAAFSRHATAALTAAERYRTALLHVAQSHLKRLSRKSAKAARPIYESFRHEIDKVADDLRQTAKENGHV